MEIHFQECHRKGKWRKHTKRKHLHYIEKLNTMVEIRTQEYPKFKTQHPLVRKEYNNAKAGQLS